MAIYLRGENWYIDFRFKGQRIRESIGPSRKDAEKIIAKKKTEIVENKYLDIRKEPDPIKFHELAKEYLKWSIENKKPSAKTRELSQTRILDRDFGEKYLHEITSFDIEAWKVKRKKKVKPSTVNRELAVLKGFFTKAFEWGRCKNHLVRGIKTFKGVAQRLRYLMPDEIQKLISNCADHIKPIFTIAVHTGMRRGEVLGLRRDQVNFEQGIIILTDTKNSKRRDIPMDETVKATLHAIDGKDPFFFASNKKQGKPYYWIDVSFHQAAEKSGIEDFKFHDLGHTFASNLVMAGEDLNTVGELLGHKDLKMTKRYAHLSPKFKKRGVNVLDHLMSQFSPQEIRDEIRDDRKVFEFKR